MWAIALVVFGLFIAGFVVFVAANAGRGRDDFAELISGERPTRNDESED